MPLPFFLAALFGKAAAGALVKSAAAKAGAAGAKGLAGHHTLAEKLAKGVAKEVAKSGVDAALSERRKKKKKDDEAP
jgi:hypothetical protein